MTFDATRATLQQQITSLSSSNFEEVALAVFQFQARHNPIYQQFLKLMHMEPTRVDRLSAIPFLPISTFKHHLLQTGAWEPLTQFESSGTTGTIPSKHAIADLSWYQQQARSTFEQFYGPLKDYCIFGLLPSYLERAASSLVYMVDDFISQSAYQQSGFFLYEHRQLVQLLQQNQQAGIPTLVIGVSFALWDLAEAYPGEYRDIIFMETGGMKGRRKELTRQELHAILTKAFQVKHIHSEYGMTELLSQAYSKGEGLFWPASSMRLLAKEINDPMAEVPFGKSGLLNIIDLANLDTVSFIATEDIGRVYPNGSFEVLGRLDASAIRGCNLMVGEV
ncbi:MAG: acyl transferase [Bacteroidota bacterium]